MDFLAGAIARQKSKEMVARNEVKVEGTLVLYASSLQVDIRLSQSHMNFKLGFGQLLPDKGVSI